MDYLSEKLQEAREQKGASLQDAAIATKIKIEYLRALETGDYLQLPPRAYVKGFLKIYARYLSLDYVVLTRLYDEMYESPDAQMVFADPKPTFPAFASGLKWKSVAGTAGTVLLVALLVWGALRLFRGTGPSPDISVHFSRVDNPFTPESIERIPIREVLDQQPRK